MFTHRASIPVPGNCLTFIFLKEALSYLFNIFPNFSRFCYHKKAHIFLITHGKILQLKSVPLRRYE